MRNEIQNFGSFLIFFFSFFWLQTSHEHFLILMSFLFVLFLLFFLSSVYSRIRAKGESDNEKKEWELLGWREILLEQSYSLMLPAGLFLHQKYLNVSVFLFLRFFPSSKFIWLVVIFCEILFHLMASILYFCV